MGGRYVHCTIESTLDKVEEVETMIAGSLRGGVAAREDSCAVCFDDLDQSSESFQYTICKHHICSGDGACLESLMKNALGSNEFPIKCPECAELVPLNDLLEILAQVGESLSRLVRGAIRAYLCTHYETVTPCFSMDCEGILPKPGNQTCACCHTAWCTDCSEESHEGTTCEERRLQKAEPALDAEALARLGVKKCPRCGSGVEKIDGCNAMRCFVCHCGFCWLCLKDCGHDAHSHFGERGGNCFRQLFHGVYD
eukprot:NODE_3739_length_925_cov_6.848174_g3438_i0.p1 GENE.NODE_3739_length_925_cov_6.848174_g3438_i0~~NODE_3739_length_925_cov_6.848174_g3438_i0.p1  ORF type:complete len:254 (+),score=31.65 NODE_3739_length_925_cov_6.848174_g3438_i0:3-764(+)